jgi:hypothetical protein
MTDPSTVAQIMAMRFTRMTFAQIGEALQPPLSTARVREILGKEIEQFIPPEEYVEAQDQLFQNRDPRSIGALSRRAKIFGLDEPRR